MRFLQESVDADGKEHSSGTAHIKIVSPLNEEGEAVGAVQPAGSAFPGTVSGDFSRIGGTLGDDGGQSGMGYAITSKARKKEKTKLLRRRIPKTFKEYLGSKDGEVLSDEEVERQWGKRSNPLGNDGGRFTGR